jgi:hypothetical protein
MPRATFVPLKGLAKEWEDQAVIRERIRKHDRLFVALDGTFAPAILVKEAARFHQILEPVLRRMAASRAEGCDKIPMVSVLNLDTQPFGAQISVLASCFFGSCS